ncbi:GroES family chaperonin [Neobacillus sp. Marseille-QA0830]
MELKPIGNRVIVSLVEETTSQNGIIIPTTVKGNLKRGMIRAIGNDVVADIRVEDVILFTENTGTQIMVKNENYYILQEDDILAIYETTNF